MIQLMSHDDDVMPDALAGLAASAALALSDIPFATLISEARVGRIGKVYHQSKRAQLELSDIDMMIGASMDSIAMVEGEMKEISEAEMLEAIKFAHEHIKIKFLLNCVYKLLFEREVRTYDGEEKTKRFTLK
jgi:polyribonucleotide nucleotidyltransferase